MANQNAIGRMTRLFTAADLKRIEAAIAQAEKGTSGEIVALVTRESGDYRWVIFAWAIVGFLLASLGLWASSARADWEPTLVETLAWQWGAALVSSFLPLIEPLWRLTVPRRLAALHVHREALANFTAAGLGETRDRTGILVYISERERRVEILADRGIHERKGNEFWRAECERIVRGIREGRAADGVCEALESIGRELAEHYPPRPGESDELANEVLLGPQDTKPH